LAERFKDIFFKKDFFTEISSQVQIYYPQFDEELFFKLVFDERWKDLELKERMRHVTFCLHETLPDDYPATLDILKKIAHNFKGFDVMVFPDYVECYGLKHWEISIPALAYFTRFCSSEFAIRPFIIENADKALSLMLEWSLSDDHHLRRLSSEGCRPRLPWAMSLPNLKKDPDLIFPILENLKDDPTEYVRKSVANNLNDISKDHPELVLERCRNWLGKSKNTDWIIKHACRTLLKAGNTKALRLFGFGDPKEILVSDFELSKNELSIGDEFHFSFQINVNTRESTKVRLEYIMYFVKSKGKLSQKVFQIIEKKYAPGSHIIKRKHSFKDLTTRKHYPGEHFISIIVNGVEKSKDSFNLSN